LKNYNGSLKNPGLKGSLWNQKWSESIETGQIIFFEEQFLVFSFIGPLVLVFLSVSITKKEKC